MAQTIVSGEKSYKKIPELLRNVKSRKFMLVCGSTFDRLDVSRCLKECGIPYVRFSDFKPNPSYDDACKGVSLFCEEGCDCIVAIGGGSALDVAKCIKLFCRMDRTRLFYEQPFTDTAVPLIAMPTTAGTGSESTRFSVIYYKGEKRSVASEYIIPDYAVLSHEVLAGLPVYQRKCTLLDALCQAIESCWSVNSTEQSVELAKEAITVIFENEADYISNYSADAAEKIMYASNLSGRAINITQTTAPHAMSYKLTTLYGIPHGHSVALSLPFVFEYMLENINDCTDGRGVERLLWAFGQIASAFGAESPREAIKKFKALLKKYEMTVPRATKAELEILTNAVNTERLNNNPVRLDRSAIYGLYERILNNEA